MKLMKILIVSLASLGLTACATAGGNTAEAFLSDLKAPPEGEHVEVTKEEERLQNLESAIVGLSDQLERVTRELERVRDGQSAVNQKVRDAIAEVAQTKGGQ